MAHYLQPSQIDSYFVKRVAMNRINGDTSVLISTQIPWLSAIICKIRLSPGPYGVVAFHYHFTPLSSDLQIPSAAEDKLRMMLIRIIGPWLDKLGICTSTGVLL